MSGCDRNVDTGSDVFGRRADGCPYERVCRLYGDSIDRRSISENHIDKSLYPVWIKRRTFFPGYFAGVCLGYGLAMLFFGQQGDSHVVFAAAIVTSTLLGGIMKKPLAVTMLLFLCFPVKIFIWIFIAAAVGSKCVKKMGKEV